ncbi:hypothetical protein Hanom_Chr06g00492631 [Helianthus anomalus]
MEIDSELPKTCTVDNDYVFIYVCCLLLYFDLFPHLSSLYFEPFKHEFGIP